MAIPKPPGVTTEALLSQLASDLKSAGREGEVTSVSRLDVGTSGMLVTALGSEGSPAAELLRAQFAGRLVSKEYLCLAVGQPLGRPGTAAMIQSPLKVSKFGGPGPRTTVSRLGKEARTLCTVLATYTTNSEPLVLCAIRLLTGRTHQIRVHLASLGRPLVSDAAYGHDRAQSELSWCRRTFLHCRWMALLDLEGGPFEAQAPLPADLLSALCYLSSPRGAQRDGATEVQPRAVLAENL